LDPFGVNAGVAGANPVVPFLMNALGGITSYGDRGVGSNPTYLIQQVVAQGIEREKHFAYQLVVRNMGP